MATPTVTLRREVKAEICELRRLSSSGGLLGGEKAILRQLESYELFSG
jgi:hypothetical protein